MKKLFVILVAVGLAGCGAVERSAATFTGGGHESCVDGVIYLQFTSGVTVKYNTDGTVATCKE